MKELRWLLTGALLMAGSRLILLAGTPGEADWAKLHPYFQQVLRERAMNAPALPLKASRTTYDAIIYTRNPDELRSAGLHLNSVLPEFVTAQVTAEELERVAGINAATYIDPGCTNVIQNDLGL
jgi:hypothetical protein